MKNKSILQLATRLNELEIERNKLEMTGFFNYPS